VLTSVEGSTFATPAATSPRHEGPPPIPLEVTDLTDPLKRRLIPNARECFEFETDGFVGKCQIKVKTEPEDPYFIPYFAGKKRLFEVQFQGRFKMPVTGDVLLGAELPGSMNLGFLVSFRTLYIHIFALLTRHSFN
jgi:hypothetical protein